MTRLTDLLSRCQQGDRSAFSELFLLYEGRIYRLAATILRDDRDAEDTLQDVFLRVFLHIKNYRGEASFETWLTSITVNVCRDRLRRRKIRQVVSLEWLRGHPEEVGPDLGEVVDERWKRQTLWALVDRLEEKYRLPVILVYGEDLPVEDAARVLRLPASTVYARLNTARKQLRAMQHHPALKGIRKLGKKEC